MRIIEVILHDFIANGIIEQDEYDLYYYCFDTFFSKLCYCSFMLGLAFIFKQISVTIAYYIGFSVIRYTSGGYHANSPGVCFVMSIAIYLGCLGLIHIVPVVIHPEILLGTLLLALLLIWRFAPVDHPNKRFSPREKLSFQKKSRISVTVCIILVAILWHFNPLISWAITIGCFVAAVSVFIAKKNTEECSLC